MGTAAPRPWGVELLALSSLLLSWHVLSSSHELASAIHDPVTPWPPVTKTTKFHSLNLSLGLPRVLGHLETLGCLLSSLLCTEHSQRHLYPCPFAQPWLVPCLVKGLFCVCRACGPLSGMWTMTATVLFPLWPAWIFVVSPPQTKTKPTLGICLSLPFHIKFTDLFRRMPGIWTQVPVPVQQVLFPTKSSL